MPEVQFLLTCWHLNLLNTLMLQEGVHRFSNSTKKNLPWRKILDFGRHMFHATRTPIDLKDKWKNMMAKDSSTITRR